jgi:hypothetical protein
MSHDERVAATEKGVKYLKEQRENKKSAVHNVPIAAFHDVRATVQVVEAEVSTQHIYKPIE